MRPDLDLKIEAKSTSASSIKIYRNLLRAKVANMSNVSSLVVPWASVLIETPGVLNFTCSSQVLHSTNNKNRLSTTGLIR